MEMNKEVILTFKKLLRRAMKEQKKGTNRPFVLGHFVTNRCMCQCKSCLWRHNDWKDVPLEDLKKFYTEAIQEGFLATNISGGEPFLRKDLGELVKFIKEDLKIPIMVTTTGYFLEDRMDEVLPYIDMLLLSLDSAKAERHDEIRGLPGLFDKLMRGVDMANEKYPNLSMQFNTCVQKGIEEEVEGLIKLAEEKNMKISFDVITDYRHGEEGEHFTETNMGLPLDKLRTLCKNLGKKKLDGAPILNSARYFKYFCDAKPGYNCHLPKMAMLVDGRGYVEDCLDLDHPIANILETPLKEIMELPRFKQLRVDCENCCSCNSPTMIDLSMVWENPQLLLKEGGIQFG